jgi:hypothetical protein
MTDSLEEQGQDTVLGPIVASLIDDLGAARERAASAETQNQFLREQVAALKSERNLLRGRLIQNRIEQGALPPGLTEADAEAVALDEEADVVSEVEVPPVQGTPHPSPPPVTAADPPSVSSSTRSNLNDDGGPSDGPLRSEIWDEPGSIRRNSTLAPPPSIPSKPPVIEKSSKRWWRRGP